MINTLAKSSLCNFFCRGKLICFFMVSLLFRKVEKFMTVDLL
jgi:hypothetical protein